MMMKSNERKYVYVQMKERTNKKKADLTTDAHRLSTCCYSKREHVSRFLKID
jgi:hypothetical protein